MGVLILLDRIFLDCSLGQSSSRYTVGIQNGYNVYSQVKVCSRAEETGSVGKRVRFPGMRTSVRVPSSPVKKQACTPGTSVLGWGWEWGIENRKPLGFAGCQPALCSVRNPVLKQIQRKYVALRVTERDT